MALTHLKKVIKKDMAIDNTFYFTVRRLCLSLSLLYLPTPSCRLAPTRAATVWQAAVAAGGGGSCASIAEW